MDNWFSVISGVKKLNTTCVLMEVDKRTENEFKLDYFKIN